MLKLYNTLTKKKDALKAKTGKRLNLFVCGPTVYDYSHLGHARTYITFDAFVRYLRTDGLVHQSKRRFDVFYLQNITDIDEKIIQRAKEKNLPAKSLATMFEKEYFKDMNALGVRSVSKYARATDHIPEIISQVQRLLKKGYAYEIEDDGLYYDIAKFKEYGKLSGRTSLQAQDAVSRIDESVQKRSKGDFALWKFALGAGTVPARARAGTVPAWPSPWGWGRPGWHIEDTAITEKRFGAQYELHGGAQDLIFPHHEAEIAQMEAISGKKPLAKHWMHTGFLTVEREKMSKSLGNFITIREFLKQHSPRALRLLVLKTHYRSPIDYSEKLLLQTQRELERIDEFVEKLHETRNLKPETQKSDFKKGFTLHASRFRKALEDDFNTPRAIAALFDLVSKGNSALAKEQLSSKDAKAILAFLKEIDAVFGFIFSKGKQKKKIPQDILKLVQKREVCRKQKQWQKADRIRKELEKKGWQLEDTPKGPKLKKLS